MNQGQNDWQKEDGSSKKVTGEGGCCEAKAISFLAVGRRFFTPLLPTLFNKKNPSPILDEVKKLIIL